LKLGSRRVGEASSNWPVSDSGVTELRLVDHSRGHQRFKASGERLPRVMLSRVREAATGAERTGE